MRFIEWLLLISLLVVFYNYAGYALLVAVWNAFRKNKTATADFFPSVSFIVAAYNEEYCIEEKIRNSLQQDYPADKIEYLFITDGSTDGTNEIIARYPQIRLLFTPERSGKSAALNRVVQAASNDILIFCDANTVLNKEAVRNITRHYQDPKTGGVAGEKKVIALANGQDRVGAGEGLYWKYESKLKQLDSDFHSVVGAAGELFSVRRSLYEPVASNVILDDFIISMKVAAKGYKIVYEPEAYAMELPSFSIKDEQKRKVRIAAGGFQAMKILRPLLSFRKQPKLYFLYVSHRVLRWTLSPVGLVVAFVCSAVLAFGTSSILYRLIFIAQLGFYGGATLAALFPKHLQKIKLFKLAYYFVFMNLSVVQGFFRSLKGTQPAAWEKARRSQAEIVAGRD
jgi:poly-beta-1,6-N-acetyl-D-glucosamine synthase